MGQIVSEIWSPEEGRLAALKAAWKNGESKSRIVFIFLGSIPIWTYLFGFSGEMGYYQSIQKFGGETWYAPHNLWREFCHFLGGALLVLPFMGFRFSVIQAIIFAIFIGALCNEIFSDIPDSGLHIKNFIDVICWTLGALFSGFVIFLIKEGL